MTPQEKELDLKFKNYLSRYYLLMKHEPEAMRRPTTQETINWWLAEIEIIKHKIYNAQSKKKEKT